MISALKIFVDKLYCKQMQEYEAAAVDIFVVQEIVGLAFWSNFVFFQ